jgi:hypothetical protein
MEPKMLTPEKLKLLQAFLGNLPPPMAQRLARAVEWDRLNDGNLFPHDLIMESLRPALRQASRPDRMPSPQRLFCEPFEDLLSASPRQEKHKGRIARASVAPVWDWLSETLIPDETRTYVRAVTSAVLHYDVYGARGYAREFWDTASKAMREALCHEAGREAARLALQDNLAVADAAEMALLLSASAFVAQIQEKLPRAASTLSEDLIWELREIYDSLVETLPDAAPYVAVIAMNRLAKPWEALKLPLMIARKTQDTMISSTDMGLAGDLLLLDIADHAHAICAVHPPAFDVDELLRHLGRFTELSSAIVKEVEIRRDGRWGQHLFRDRALVGEAMGELMKLVPREILAVLPMHRSGAYGSGPRVPVTARPLEPEKVERAVRYAKLLVGCRHLAAAASFQAACQNAFDDVLGALAAFNDGIEHEIRSTSEEVRIRAEPFHAVAVELTAILFSQQEAEHMRRRAAIAA